MTDLVWAALAHVAKRLEPRAAGEMRGSLVLVEDTDLKALELCLGHSDDTGVLVHGDSAAAALGQTVEISFEPRVGWAAVAPNLNEFLKQPGNRVRARQRFLILDTKSSSDDGSKLESEVGRYLLAVKLVKSFKEVAGFLDSDDQSLVFISNGRFDVPVNYTADDLSKMDVDEVQALTTLIPTDTHKKQCVGILATAIVDLVRAQPPSARFPFLLSHAKELRAAYDQGYKMYAAGFSYEKLKDTVETARVEYVGKIHKVLSDIQNQLLGIPVATIIVATQLKEDKGGGPELFINTAVLLGAWVFVALTLLLIRNQQHTLKVLKDEISRQKRQLLREYAPVAEMLSSTFTTLESRARTQTIVLRTIMVSVVAGLGLANWSYAILTPDALTRLRAAKPTTIVLPSPTTSAGPSASTASAPVPQAVASSPKP
ncbi:hypothetical protein HNP48_001526 [Acidovorax soli]|uniref:Uncharacterized protein n=1 Tax=Acidovorax soli TaxID=592050 RepID=A0A7X0PC60_9BURK|nr:hypothetical protein [Acidovorax soli]MBB6558862.1 hypothetical protein [Acidovorax soli]